VHSDADEQRIVPSPANMHTGHRPCGKALHVSTPGHLKPTLMSRLQLRPEFHRAIRALKLVELASAMLKDAAVAPDVAEWLSLPACATARAC